MSIPFVFEMTSLLDWWCASTSLDVYMWLQIEEIYAQLFRNACQVNYRRADHVVLQGHTEQPAIWKFVYGILIFLLLASILVIHPSTPPPPHILSLNHDHK
jgi:hypothetical protein